MNDLNTQLGELKSNVKHLDMQNLGVSKAAVGWHIDHSLRVINGIIRTLEESDSSDYQRKFNVWRSIFLTLNFLPRGKGRAPKRVLPESVVTENDLNKRLGYAYENLSILKRLPSNAHFPHPYFGQLNRRQSEKFLVIHTEHHLKIIREILRG